MRKPMANSAIFSSGRIPEQAKTCATVTASSGVTSHDPNHMNKGFELRHLHRRVRDGPLTGGRA